MEKVKIIFITIFLISIVGNLFSFKFDFSLTGYLTFDLNTGAYDNFPISYLTVTLPSPLDNFSLKITDYITSTHGTTEIFGYNIIIPRYYFIDSKFDFNNWKITAQIGRLRLSRNLSQNFESVRIGGFKFDTYKTNTPSPLTIGGIAGYLSTKVGSNTYEFGGAYSFDLGTMAIYSVTNLDFGTLGTGKLGVYYENRYQNMSLNYQHTSKLNIGQFSLWAGIAAAQTNIFEPSFLIGSNLKSYGINLSGQFVWIGANKYDVEFASGEPSNPNTSYAWNVMAELGYDFGQMYLAAFAKHNSVWSSNNFLPLYGIKIKIADLTLSIANGDLSSTLAGNQNILLQLTYNYKSSLDLYSLFASTLSNVDPSSVKQKTEVTSTKIAQIISAPEGSKVTVTGTVLAPTGLLANSTTYIQDETGAIMLYGKSIPNTLQIGDVVTVSGTTKVYNGIPEIVVDSITKVGTNSVKVLEVKSLSKEMLSNLVKVTGNVNSVSKDTIVINTGESDVKIYIKASTGISTAKIKEGSKMTIIGIVSLFKEELEVLPRSESDLIVF